MVALILAAGYGTRLYPLTLDKPKALLEVGSRTILDRIVKDIELIKECTRIFIVTNDRFYGYFKEWKKSVTYSLDIDIINDGTASNKTRLGAIGDINLVLVKKRIKDDLFILGSDNLFEFDLREFIKFGIEKRPFSSIALLDLKDKNLVKKYGVCDIDKDSRVTDFEEKPETPKSALIATALYIIPKEKIEKIHGYMSTGLSKDAPGNLMKWLAEKDKLFGYVISGAWYDIGDVRSLREADKKFKQGFAKS